MCSVSARRARLFAIGSVLGYFELLRFFRLKKAEVRNCQIFDRFHRPELARIDQNSS
jgi:hypothetical protein